jgi:hypothetical protein
LQQNIDLRYSEKEINKKTQLNAFVVFWKVSSLNLMNSKY